MKTFVIATFTLLAATALAGDAVLDPGTGREPARAGDARPGLVTPATQTYTLGYTTDAVVSHYRSLDAPSLSGARGDIVAQGHTLVPVSSLSGGSLDGLDGLILGVVNAFVSLTPAQLDVVQAFVLGGGNLYFLGENNGAFNANNVAVGSRFGIVHPAQWGDPLETVLDLVVSHPIIEGPQGPVALIDGSVNSPGAYGSMVDPGPHGLSILDFPGGASACVVIEAGELAPGAGFVVAVAEVNIWENNQLDLADNREFWNNIFAYSPGTVTVEAATWGSVKALFE